MRSIENMDGLIGTIGSLFGVNLHNLDLRKYVGLPTALRCLYAIEDFFELHDCKFKTIRFFNNQFHLIPYSKLKLNDNTFDIVFENQNNWRVALSMESQCIYLSEHYELPYNSLLPSNLEDFLISFALHETMFNCKYYCQLEYSEIDEIAEEIDLKPLWNGREMINYPVDFYHFNGDVIIMNAGWIVLATNDEEQFFKMKQRLKMAGA
jgi:hypothetical protein